MSNTYVGARYVPLIKGKWTNTIDYEPLTIVTYNSNSYTSKCYVPIGIDIANATYWVKTGDFNGITSQLSNDVDTLGRGSVYYLSLNGFTAGDITDNFITFLSNISNNDVLIIDKYNYILSKNVTCNCNLVFTNGSLSINSNATLSVTKQINAPQQQIFYGDGNLKLLNMTLYPEWFGAKQVTSTDYDSSPAFNKMFNSIDNSGIVELKTCENNGTLVSPTYFYYLGSTVTIQKSHIIVNGNNASISGNGSPILNIINTSYAEEIDIKNLHIYGNNCTNDGVVVTNIQRFKLFDTLIFYCKRGVVLTDTGNAELTRIICNFAMDTTSLGDCYGFYIQGTNASLRLNNCHGADGYNAGTSFYLSSKVLKDIYLFQCESALAKNGIVIEGNGTEPVEAFDMFIDSCIIDGFKDAGIIVNNILTGASINIVNNWLTAGKDSQYAIQINNTSSVNVSQNEIKSTSTQLNGIVFNSAFGSIISNNLIISAYNGIALSNSNDNVVSNNMFTSASYYSPNSSVYNVCVQLNGTSSFNSINGNVVHNNDVSTKYNIGCEIASGCNNNFIIYNIFNSTKLIEDYGVDNTKLPI